MEGVCTVANDAMDSNVSTTHTGEDKVTRHKAIFPSHVTNKTVNTGIDKQMGQKMERENKSECHTRYKNFLNPRPTRTIPTRPHSTMEFYSDQGRPCQQETNITTTALFQTSLQDFSFTL
eukprot:10664044-Ditylum_brightwellii.AAC.1